MLYTEQHVLSPLGTQQRSVTTPLRFCLQPHCFDVFHLQSYKCETLHSNQRKDKASTCEFLEAVSFRSRNLLLATATLKVSQSKRKLSDIYIAHRRNSFGPDYLPA